MTPCYTCSNRAEHAVNLNKWKPICKNHLKEVIEEEDYLEIMTIARWEEQHDHRTAS